MTTHEKFLEFLSALGRLRRIVLEEHGLVLVEGVKDRRALTRIGLPADSIVLLNEGHSLLEVAEGLISRQRPVVLLTDWDGKGGKLSQHMARILHGTGLPVDTEIRRRMARAVREDLVSVEGLSTWAEKNAEAFREPLPTESG